MFKEGTCRATLLPVPKPFLLLLSKSKFFKICSRAIMKTSQK